MKLQVQVQVKVVNDTIEWFGQGLAELTPAQKRVFDIAVMQTDIELEEITELYGSIPDNGDFLNIGLDLDLTTGVVSYETIKKIEFNIRNDPPKSWSSGASVNEILKSNKPITQWVQDLIRDDIGSELLSDQMNTLQQHDHQEELNRMVVMSAVQTFYKDVMTHGLDCSYHLEVND